ncbi:MAG: hypothetical protein MJA83_13175, partial [Gammaproteobacteria bacterium]|nr:hypothetical protein [Gammaproteobacteria bacterium]
MRQIGSEAGQSDANRRHFFFELVPRTGNLSARVQVFAQPVSSESVELTSKVVRTRIRAVAVAHMADGGQLDLGSTEPASLAYRHADVLAERGAPDSAQVFHPDAAGLSELFSGLSSQNCEVRELRADQRCSQKLLLELHYFRDFYHITSLLGRRVARVLASHLNPQYKATVPQKLIPVPLELVTDPAGPAVQPGTKAKAKAGAESYQLHIKLVDWSRLDPDVEDLSTLCERFELTRPDSSDAKGMLVFHRLEAAFQRRWNKLHEALGLQVPRMPAGPLGPGSISASLLGLWLPGSEPGVDLVEALDLDDKRRG